MLFDGRVAGLCTELFCSGEGYSLDVRGFEPAFRHTSRKTALPRSYAIRVLLSRMVAVKNPMEPRLARSPRARIIAGSASRPAANERTALVLVSQRESGGFGIRLKHAE
jgi:hypothetical protein